MGVTISSQNQTVSPLIAGSTSVGFISFFITLLTFLNVFWSDLITMSMAETQIVESFSNLKQGLYEERIHLRTVRMMMRRRARVRVRLKERDKEKEKEKNGRDNRRSGSIGFGDGKEFDRGGGGDWFNGEEEWEKEEEILVRERSMKVMRSTIRHMMSKTRDLERPFLKDEGQYDREGWDVEDLDFGNVNEKSSDGWDWYSTSYKPCGVRERILWLRRKSDVRTLLEVLSHVKVRRMAQEVGDLHFMMDGMDREMREMEDNMHALEQRLSRVVGIRRVN